MKNLLMVVLAALGLCSSCSAQDSIPSLSPEDFAEALKTDTTAVVVDVRTPEEYAGGHLAGAVLLDVQNAEAFARGLDRLSRQKTYYVYCRSGRRSMTAAGRMRAAGFSVVNMSGGILAWRKSRLPVTE